MEEDQNDLKLNDNFFNEAFGALEQMMIRPKIKSKENYKPPQQIYREYKEEFNKIIYGEEKETE